MTTPDTAAVRSWAREQGLVVADRGRLPAEVVHAYTAAHPAPGSDPTDRPKAARKPGTTTRRRPAAGPGAASRGAAGRTATGAAPGTVERSPVADKPVPPRRKAVTAAPEQAAVTEPAPERTAVASERAVQPAGAPTEETVPASAQVAVVPAPVAAEDDRRLAELVEQVAELGQRVAALEAAAATRPARTRFRFGR